MVADLPEVEEGGGPRVAGVDDPRVHEQVGDGSLGPQGDGERWLTWLGGLLQSACRLVSTTMPPPAVITLLYTLFFLRSHITSTALIPGTQAVRTSEILKPTPEDCPLCAGSVDPVSVAQHGVIHHIRPGGGDPRPLVVRRGHKACTCR